MEPVFCRILSIQPANSIQLLCRRRNWSYAFLVMVSLYNFLKKRSGYIVSPFASFEPLFDPPSLSPDSPLKRIEPQRHAYTEQKEKPKVLLDLEHMGIYVHLAIEVYVLGKSDGTV